MRNLIIKLGFSGSAIVITLASVVLSVIVTRFLWVPCR